MTAGEVRVGGVAWQQHVGIEGVEVAVDGNAWQQVEIASGPTADTWVQWAGTVSVAPGDHVLRVRATSAAGEVQTGVERDPVPDGATGWHDVEFTRRPDPRPGPRSHQLLALPVGRGRSASVITKQTSPPEVGSQTSSN